MLSGLVGRARQIVARPLFWYVVIAALLLLFVGRDLVFHPARLSPAETAAKQASSSLSQIINHPINAPHNLLAWALHSVHLSWRTSLRLSSILFGLLFAWSFYSLASGLFGKYIGLMGMLIFTFTPIYLILARQGTAEVMYLSIISIMAVYAWTVKRDNKSFGLGALVILGSLLLYTPGIIWWLAGSIILARKKLADIVEAATPPVVAASFLLGILILVPLITALIKDWQLIKVLALIPEHIRPVLTVVKETAWMVIALVARTPYHHIYFLGRLPVLSVLETALVFFGGYALWTAAKSKLFSFAAVVILAILAAGLNNNLVLLSLSLPVIGILIAAGLRYLYIEWRGVFPRNPVARILALTLVAVVVATQLLFGVRYAAVAWPDTMAVKNTYVLK